MEKRIIGGEYMISSSISTIAIKEVNHYYYASGRTALAVIIDSIRKSLGGAEHPRICIPDYVCGSVVDCLVKACVELSFYRIDKSLLPSQDFWELINQSDAVLLINYFGYIDINSLTYRIRNNNRNIRIIVDDVMNYYGFAQYEEYDYSFTSFRKWFPVPDGAEIKCTLNDAEIPRIGENNMFYRYKLAGNILKNYRDYIGDDICLELIKKGEELLDSEYIASCSNFTKCFMEIEDKREAAKRRKRNAEVLHEGLDRLGIKHIYRCDAIPLFIPIFIKNRDDIRKAFFRNSVFCPVHWPYDWQNKFFDLKINPLYYEELSLVCDQRYGEEEMAFQLEILNCELRNS